MAPGATSRKARGEKSQGGVEKPLLGWWNEATTSDAVGGGLIS